MNVKNVTALPGHKLKIMFDDGVSGIIELAQFVQTGIFSSLQDEYLFNKVYTNGYSIAWNDKLEIDALTVYAELLNPEDILNVNVPQISFFLNQLIP